MVNLLEEMSKGLRAAGGVMSRHVYDTQREEAQNVLNRDDQKKQVLLGILIHGVERGAISPEAFQQHVQKLGVEAPQMGPSASTQKSRRQEASAQRLKAQRAGWDREFAQRFPGLVAHPEIKPQEPNTYDVNEDLEGGTDTDMMQRFGGDGGPGGTFGDPLPGPAGQSKNESEAGARAVNASELLHAARYWANKDKGKARLFLDLYKESRTRRGKVSGR